MVWRENPNYSHSLDDDKMEGLDYCFQKACGYRETPGSTPKTKEELKEED